MWSHTLRIGCPHHRPTLPRCVHTVGFRWMKPRIMASKACAIWLLLSSPTLSTDPPHPHILRSHHTALLTAPRKSKVPPTQVQVLRFLRLASPCPGSWLSWLPLPPEFSSHVIPSARPSRVNHSLSLSFSSFYWLHPAMIYFICIIYFYPRM